jgi:hypothetical protein
VHLVEDHRLAGEPEQPHEAVADLQDRQQGLIDGADAEGGQNRLYPVLGEPRHGHHRPGRGVVVGLAGSEALAAGLRLPPHRLEPFGEHRPAVQQLQVDDVVGMPAAEEAGHPGEHLVAGGHRGHRHVQALPAERPARAVGPVGPAVGQVEGRLGLALAHRGLDEHQPRAVEDPGDLGGLLLQGTRRKAEQLGEGLGFGRGDAAVQPAELAQGVGGRPGGPRGPGGGPAAAVAAGGRGSPGAAAGGAGPAGGDGAAAAWAALISSSRRLRTSSRFCVLTGWTTSPLRFLRAPSPVSMLASSARLLASKNSCGVGGFFAAGLVRPVAVMVGSRRRPSGT